MFTGSAGRNCEGKTADCEQHAANNGNLHSGRFSEVLAIEGPSKDSKNMPEVGVELLADNTKFMLTIKEGNIEEKFANGGYSYVNS